MSAFVYLVEELPFENNSASKFTKIGYSKNPPEWRLEANLKRGNPRVLRIAVAYEFDTEKSARLAEGSAHDHFHKFGLQKEWFRLRWDEVAEWCDLQGWKRRS